MDNIVNKKTQVIIKKHKYFNPYLEDTKRKWFHYFLWQIGLYNDGIHLPLLPKDFSYPSPGNEVNISSPNVTWINHCTFLIQIDELTILTDPIWSKRCSPISCIGPQRKHPSPIDIQNLPPVHIVLISHNHYDHLDVKSIKMLYQIFPNILFIVPKGVKKWFTKKGITNVIELSWWESQNIVLDQWLPAIKVTAVPAQHFSGRGLFDCNKTLWCGFIMDFFRKESGDKRLYFVGDTGYNSQIFKEIGNNFKNIDLSLIPIGTYIPLRFMSPVHINPERAVLIHKEVESKMSIGMHWYTFRLSEEERLQPMYDLFLAMKESELNPHFFRVLFPGQQINW